MLREVLSGGTDFVSIIMYFISSLVVIFLAMPIHEFAHGFIAEKLGDKTPRWQGRITLNPLAHIDWMGAACILLFGFGWARPVQVNANGFRNPKRDMAIVALAGPVSNVILAFIALLVCNAVEVVPMASDALYTVLYYIHFIFYYIAVINISLAIFNLIPIPPFDGSRLLTALLPYKYYNLLMRYERYIFWGLLLLLWTDVLDVPLSFLSGKLMNGLYALAELPFIIFK